MTVRSSLPGTVDFLNRVAHAIAQRDALPHKASDYRVARVLGVTAATVSGWRTGRSGIGEDAALRVAEILGVDAADVLVCLQAEKNRRNAPVRKVWERLAAHALAVVFAAVIGVTVMHSTNASARTSNVSILYIMRIL